ncbi:hypothetical protein PMAYCL1PPCAC_04770, partial [Pristionchus mayeri]
YSKEIAAGVYYLHKRDTLHRDLKPENLALLEISRKKGRSFIHFFPEPDIFSELITVIGTRPYMAPELIKNEKCTEKIDIWSFGVVFWEMISGRKPYENIPDAALLYAIG